jgi:hypothetical protein
MKKVIESLNKVSGLTQTPLSGNAQYVIIKLSVGIILHTVQLVEPDCQEKKMLISKEKFINYLNKYKEAWEEQERFHDALRPFFDFPVCTYRDNLMTAYEELLVEVSECQEEDDIFSWWLYESPDDDQIITVTAKDGTISEYNVATPEGLYNYLITYYGDNK